MKANQKNSEKKVKKKSNFSVKSLLFLLFTVFILGSMATSLASTIHRTVRAIGGNVAVQEELKKTQAEIAEQNKKIDGLKSPEGAEAISRADGMVKEGEVPVQIQFAPGGEKENNEIAEESKWFNPMNGLFCVLALMAAVTSFILIKKKRITFPGIGEQIPEESDRLIPRGKNK